MKKYYLVLGTAILVSVMVLASWSPMAAQGTSDSQLERAPVNGSDDNPSGSPEVRIPARYQPVAGADAADTRVATVYFTPQDQSTSTTVLFLYNTGTVAATVGLETFGLNGDPLISTSVTVPPAGLVRICADEVQTASGSWQDAVLVNFTTSSAYAKMTLPAGVHADAYVAWNDGPTYDPIQVVPTLPLRFSSDPPTVFLPVMQKN